MHIKNNSEKKIIAFVGLMGVGKTTVGYKLANRLGFYFIDLDQEIEDREGESVSQIFAKKGEKYFREVEKNLIKEIVFRDEKIVLSLGGGAFMDDEVRKILKNNAKVIWLFASIDEILYRVGSKLNRPLLNGKNKRKVLEELAKKRYPIYSEADFKFDTTNQNHESLIDKIIKEIK
jgi:shikimate kinase